MPDGGDAIASNPNHNWSVTLSGAAIAARYGVGNYQALLFTARNGLGDMGGRVITMQIVGSAGTVTRSGPGFASDWGLRSDWFTAVGPPTILHWYLRNSDSPGPPDLSFPYGTPGDTPVVGDWNNGPVDGVGVFRDGQWYLRNSASPGAPDLSFAYGGSGYVPVVGRWNPSATGIGVFRNGNWYLRPSVSPGPATAAFAYGSPGDTPVVGDWNNDAIDTIGVYRDGTWYLRNSNTPGPPDLVVSYGGPGYQPLVGSWQGNNGGQSLGVYDGGGGWYLRNCVPGGSCITPGPPTIVFAYGAPGYMPIRGNWNGGSIHGIGVVVAT